MTHLLELLPVDPANPLAIIPALEEALTGQRTLLPVPANDPARTNLLRNTLKPGAPIDEDIALVVSTSGSTGKPKGAMLTPANLISSADATHQELGGEGQWLLAMPAAYIAGLQVLVRSMVAGVEPGFIDLTRGFNVAEFATRAHELAQTGERTYTALTPMQLAKATSTLKGIDALRTFSAVLVGGAATNPRLLDSAKKLRINVVTTYGSSETSGGWFRTSDAGELDGGVLTVLGRTDNVISSGGLKLHPEVLEEELLLIDGVTAATVIGKDDDRFGQRICAAYTGSATVPDILDALADAEDAGRIAHWQIPKELKIVAALPQLGPGKVDRAAVKELFD